MSEGTSNTSKVIKGISSQTLVTIVLGVVEIFSFSIMSRLLAQEDFGYYAAITAITTIFAAFSDTGIGSAVVQQKELTKRYIDNAFTISFLFGGFISFLLLITARPLSRIVIDESMQIPLMLCSVTLLLNSLSSVNIGLMERKLQFLHIGLIKLIALVVTTVVAVYLALKGFGFYAILTKAILTSVITFILSLFLCKTRYRFALDVLMFNKIFKFSGWLMASGLFRNLAHQIDKLLMPRMLSVSALGAYNRPKDFVEQISDKVTGIFDIALFPVLSSIQDNYAALRSSFKRSLSLMNTFALLITLAFVFNSGLCIRVFFGNEWLELKSVMCVISFSLLFNFDGRLADCYLRSLALTKQQFYFRVFEAAFKTIGIVIGAKWDILGVALSVVLTNSIIKTIKIIYVGEKIGMTYSDVSGCILASWRFALIFVPICSIAFIMAPNSWGGDIFVFSVFIGASIVVFLLMPRFVGIDYYNDVYKRILSLLLSRIKHD